ncbi:hypothetical protein SLOPH_2120 [Spraguea lophii 42_110]|uniref:Uncharacterized protein n=1 Tax=Spraguea lophii (strain 42_110) TaxID=1358809 RepID=S7WAK5_SPRLO|nr:hypothetical protein SLOPH_2120 [Spraguea lophii 42_110]
MYGVCYRIFHLFKIIALFLGIILTKSQPNTGISITSTKYYLGLVLNYSIRQRKAMLSNINHPTIFLLFFILNFFRMRNSNPLDLGFGHLPKSFNQTASKYFYRKR